MQINAILLAIFLSCSLQCYGAEISPQYWAHIFIEDTANGTYELIKCDGTKVIAENDPKISDKYWIIPKFKKPDKFSIEIIHEGYNLLHVNKEKHTLNIQADTLSFTLRNPTTDDDKETYHFQDFSSHNLTIQNESYEYSLTPYQMNRIVHAKKLSLVLNGTNRDFCTFFSKKNYSYWNKFYSELEKQLTK